jgi:hypothetical protein
LDLVAKVANAALRACWYQKWLVHRRVRPENMSGRVHLIKTNVAQYPVHADLIATSSVLDAVYQAQGSYLLAQAYPEGAPIHPSHTHQATDTRRRPLWHPEGVRVHRCRKEPSRDDDSTGGTESADLIHHDR